MKPIDHEKLISLYNSGSSQRDLQKIFKAGKLRIKSILTEHGIKIREGNSPKISNKERKSIVVLWQKHLLNLTTMREIGIKFRISRQRVYEILKEEKALKLL